MSTASASSRRLILVKHAQPVLDPAVPSREWRLTREGEEQSQRLAGRLRTFLPFTLVSSPEPKATRTAEIVAGTLGITSAVVDLLSDDAKRLALCERAAAYGRSMVWPAVARRYLQSFDLACSQPSLPRVSRGLQVSVGATINSVDF